MQKSNPKTRRETLKLLSLAGFGIILPSCLNEVKPDSIVIEPTVKDTLRGLGNVDMLERVLDESGVIFLAKEADDYELYRNGFNLVHQTFPKVIALCTNTTGVQAAVRYANREGLKIAVKSGGHSFEGFSSNEDGLVINLSQMNEMEWLDGNKLKAGPGVLLKQLYDFILPEQRILPAGSCGTVGLAGLTLGGGYGFFGRELGLTCDNLIEATMVDGKGELHKAVDGDELMWALRGGGNGNFGIVTELIYKTHPAPNDFVRYRLQAYKLDKTRATELTKTWFEHAKLLPETCFSAHVLNGSTLTILVTNYGADDALIQNMIDVLSPLMDKTSIGERKTLEDALPTYYGTQHPIYFKNSSAGYYEGFETIADVYNDILDVVLNHKIIFQINTLGGQINSDGFKQNSCYPHRDQPFLCELQSYWKKESQKEQRLSAFNSVQNILNAAGIDKQYRNYPNVDFPNWEQAYFGENYSKLQSIKAKFDQSNVIQHKQSIKLK